MSREIKFRIWNKQDKTFRNDLIPCLEGTHIYLLDDLDNQQIMARIPITNGIVLQQFTGFKDENNKDIYEGDIVIDSDGFSKEVFFNDKGFWSIRYINKITSITKDIYFTDLLFERCQFSKIQGNIFENPELLK